MNRAINYQRFPSQDEVWKWQTTMQDFGPRLTGSAGHQRLINYFADELQNLGLEVHRDTYHLRHRWEARRWGIWAKTENGFEEIPTTSYYPYSGQTPPEGIEAELVYCPGGADDFAKACGKIAIIDVNAGVVPTSFLFTPRTLYPSDLTVADPFRCVVLTARPDLRAAAEAGVLGVICVWQNLADDNAMGQEFPFDTPLQNCPALWVGTKTGERLKSLADHHTGARLVLEANVEEQAPTDTLYAVLPGQNLRETILITTHTDGPNATEENGGVGLLALAQYFAAQPPSERKRTLVFVFASGHFQIPELGIEDDGQATTLWLHDHPELWDGKGEHARALAALTIEHLGCLEWKDDADHSRYEFTGQVDIEYVYTGNDAMAQLYVDCLQDRKKVRTALLKPAADELYYGEGHTLWGVGVTTISFLGVPDYLLALKPSGDIEKLDPELLYEQIETCAEVVSRLDTMSPAEIGQNAYQNPEFPSRQFC